jgi:hypothetical protein
MDNPYIGIMFGIFKRREKGITIRTGVKEMPYNEEGKEFMPWFQIGAQRFYLDGVATEDDAKWYCEMMEVAFEKLKRWGFSRSKN